MSRTSPHRSLMRGVLLMGALVVSSCDEPVEEPETSPEEEQIVFATTHSTLETVPLLAYVADGLFSADPAWKSLTAEQAGRLAIGFTRARLEFVLDSLDCEREFQTDQESTYLEASFSNCKLAGFDLEGDFRADVTVETEPCVVNGADRECAKAIVWSLGGPDLAIGKENTSGTSRFVGPVIIRAPTDDAVPMSWETQQGFSLQAADGEQFATRSTASWFVDDETLCMDISLDARLEIPAIGDKGGTQEGIEIGEIVISAQNVMLCPNSCPSEGTIEMAYGNGSILSWTYIGTDTVVVTGPGGREFEGMLQCAGDAPLPPDVDGG